MSLNIFTRVRLSLRLNPLGVTARYYATSNTAEPASTELDLSKVSDEPIFIDEPTDGIDQKRNKSRLSAHHRNVLFGTKPFEQPHDWYHSTTRYKKRMLGRYGLSALDVTPGVLWPTKEEVADAKEYERVAYPRSLQEEMNIIKTREQKKKEAILKRDAEVAMKVAKTEKWIKELQQKVTKKEKAVLEAKQRKVQMIEEIRREHNLTFINPEDTKIQALFAQKEKIYKKQLKQEKKMQKEEKRAKYVQQTGNEVDSEQLEPAAATNEQTDKQ